MIRLQPITAFLIITLYSCAQKHAAYKPDPAAVQLNNQAMELVRYIDNPDSSKKAILLLDRATSIDSNYFTGYSNKVMFYYQLGQIDKVISTNNKMLQLRPNAQDLYLRGGMVYELVGDTNASNAYFTKSLSICNTVLDTMSRNNRDFVMITTNKAINLVMLNDSVSATRILNELYNSLPDNPGNNLTGRDYIKQYMNKSRKQVFDMMTAKN